MRERSEYTIKQIESVKVLLCEPTTLLIAKRINQISKLTGVSTGAIISIKSLSSWIDVREDLNEKMLVKSKIVDVDYVLFLFENKHLTLKNLSNKFGIKHEKITYLFRSNKLPYSTQNQTNKIYQQNIKVMKYYNKGVKTTKNIKNITGLSDLTIRKIFNNNNIVNNIVKNKRKNREKNCDIKGISWDIKDKRWFLRISHNNKQVPIGKFDTVEEANNIKLKLETLIKQDDYEGIIKIKNECRRESTPMKKIKSINIKTKEIINFNGIGIASRELGINRKEIERVLSKGKKSEYIYTAKGFTFQYIEQIEQIT